MQNILYENNIKGPINKLFNDHISRSVVIKKKEHNIYNMSGVIPSIKIENEETSRPSIKIKNPTRINGVEITKEEDALSDVSGSTIEPNYSKPKIKESASKYKKEGKKSKNENLLPQKLKSDSKFRPEDYQNFINNSKTKNKTESEEEYSDDYSDDYSGSDNSDSESEVSNLSKKD